MAGVWLWVRREWGRGGAGLAGLALLIAVVAGVTLAVASGARRTATAFSRFQDETNAFQVQADIDLGENPTAVDAAAFPDAETLADTISAVDGVRGVRVGTFLAASPDTDTTNLFAVALGAARGEAPGLRVVEGRLPSEGAAEEIVVNEAGAEEWGLRIGSDVELTTLAPDQFQAFVHFAYEEPRGPKVPARVVGVVRDVEDISDFPEPFFLAGPGFLKVWGDQVANVIGTASINADPSRIDEVIAGVDAATGPLFRASRASDQDDFANRVNRTIDVEVTMLTIFAVAAGLAGLVVVGQALARTAAAATPDESTLSALGVDRAGQLLGSVVRVAPALVVGPLLAVPLAFALSPFFPRGLARKAEPDAGFRAEPAVLLLGSAAVVLVVIAVAVLTSWRSITAGSGAATTHPRRPGLVARLASPMPVVPALGAQFALERDRRRGLAGGMSGVVGAAILVGGVVGVATVERSRDELLTDSRLYGADWDLQMDYYGLDDPEATLSDLAADPDVTAVGTRTGLMVDDGLLPVTGEHGSTRAEPTSYTWVKGARGPTLSSGRPPGSGETVIGEALARRLGVAIGDTVVATGAVEDVPLRITGWLVHPGNDDLDRGMVVTPDTLDAMRRHDCPEGSEESSCYLNTEGIGVAVGGHADRDTVVSRLRARYPTMEPVRPPSIVDNLGQMGSTPWLLAGFLAIIGGAGLAHALITGVRRHRRDVAVVRTLGLRPAQARWVVRWQAAVMAVLGAAAGLLLGLIAGRLVWQRVVEGIGALVSVSVPPAAIVAAPTAAVGLALVLSIFPGRRAARLRPAFVLRAE